MSGVPILTAKLRAKDETGRTLRSLQSNMRRSLGSIGRMAAGILTRDLVRGFAAATREGAMLAGQVETLQAAFTRFTQAAGVEDMTLQKLRDAVQGTVGDVGLLTAANNAMALGLPVNRLNDLFSAAMSVGHAMGRTTLQAVNDVATGIGRQSRLILDNLGIIVNAEYAQKQYAAALGKTTTELTEQERKQAFISAAMGKLMERAVLLEGTTSDLQISYERWGAAVENLKRKLGEIFLPVLIQVTDALLAIATTTATVLDSLKQGDWAGAWQQIVDSFGKIDIGFGTTGMDIDWQTIWDNIVEWWGGIDWDVLFTGLADLVGNLWSEIILPGLQAIGDITAGFLNWFGDVDWTAVFEGMNAGMAKFWPIFQDAVGDLTTLILEWFSAIDWDKVFSGMVSFATEFNKFFYDQIEAFSTALAKGFWDALWDWITGSGSTGFGPLHGGPIGGAGGYEGYVSKPTLFLAGEAGGESVSIRNSGQQGGGSGYSPTFVFHIGSLSGDRAGAEQLGRMTATVHMDELRRRGKK